MGLQTLSLTAPPPATPPEGSPRLLKLTQDREAGGDGGQRSPEERYLQLPFPCPGHLGAAGPTSFLKLLSYLVKETGLLLFLPPLWSGFLRLPCGASSSTVPALALSLHVLGDLTLGA